jgi:DNA-binding transcriptional regulator YiaG
MTAKVKKIISAIDRLQPAEKAAVRKHLSRENSGQRAEAGGRNGRGKRLTAARRNGYNARTMRATNSIAPPPDVPPFDPEVFKACRKATGLSQEKFGEKIGLDRKTVNRFENGHRKPSGNEWAGIAVKLGILNDLLAGV